MPPDTATILGWLLILFAASGFYALVLSKLRSTTHTYDPDWIWLTVVIGNALICGALWGIELSGVGLTFLTIVLANIAAGAPVIVWQVAQQIARRARNGHVKP